jgi:uncharacterized protein (DUF1330 family)
MTSSTVDLSRRCGNHDEGACRSALEKEEFAMPSIEPSPDQVQKFVADADDETPIVMINLLRYRDRAGYPPGSAAEPCSGREAYQRYVAGVMPILTAAGGSVFWLGNVKRMVIGPEGEEWDDALLVRYPSGKAFFDMVSRPDYQKVAVHRTAALADSRLIATVTATSGS